MNTWELRKPRPDSAKKPIDMANGLALRGAMESLGSATVGGRRENLLTYAPALTQTDACTDLVPFVVPLRGPNLDRKGRGVVKMLSETTTAADETSGVKDSDKLKITCLPGF